MLGYPGGGVAREPTAAAVRAVIEPVGRDIYGEGEVRRRVYELQATIAPGNSGGPFVLPNGRVAGLVFASSVVDDDVGLRDRVERVRCRSLHARRRPARAP